MINSLSIGFLTPEYVTPDKAEGGLANYLRKVAHALVERNHFSTVFVWSQEDEKWEDGDVKVIGVKVPGELPLPDRLRGRMERVLPALKLYRAAKRMEKAVWSYHRSQPLDLLHASSFMAPAFSLRKNRRIPLVCRVSSYTPLLRSAYGVTRGFAEYLSDWFEIRQILDADSAFAPSKFVAETFQRLEGIQMEVLNSPLDEQTDEPDDSLYRSKFSGLRYLLSFGALSKIKGTDLFADAIPAVLQQHPDVHFIFIGRDDGLPNRQKMMDHILSHAEKYKDRIHYLSSVNQSLLYPVIANSIAVVMPSRVDNYPNACLEAFSLGVPVIGTRNSSLDEMIADQETGLLIQNGNAGELASAIHKMISLSQQDRSRMKMRIQQQIDAIQAQDRIGELIRFYNRTITDFRKRNGFE